MPEWHEHSDQSLIEYAAGHLQHAAPASMEMERRLMVAIKHLDEESARYARTMVRLTWAVIVLTVVLGIVAVIQLWATVRPTSPSLGQQVRSAQQDRLPPGRSDEHIVEVPGRIIQLPAARWKSMQNEVDWAVNFEDAAKGDRHKYGRVVTIYKLPMSEDRRLGEKISNEEYLELFVVDPGTVTAQVRVDKGRYWVLSRETFLAPSMAGVKTERWHSFYDKEFGLVRNAFQAELDSTRYLLQSSF